MTDTAVTRVRAAFRRLDELAGTEHARPEAWVTLRDRSRVLHDAESIDRRLERGERLPLAGMVIAVKNNIDVAGLFTTCGSRSRVVVPSRSATVVARVVESGAVVLGTTSMDQFATGVVGTRSAFGAVRSVSDPNRIAGGSSSGSAVVVAQGIVDAALSTDTAGSGRVPAALNGIVWIKPTRGLLPLTGVVPASPSFDVVGVLARDVGTAQRCAAVMCGPDADDPASRAWPENAPHGAPATPRVGVPTPGDLDGMDPGHRQAFADAVSSAAARGAELVTVDIAGLLAVGQMLYGSGIVAERAAAFGEEFATISDPDPAVLDVVERGRGISAVDYLRDMRAMREQAARAVRVFETIDALMLPTVGEHPTIADTAANPAEVNARMGRFTTFANLADLSAIAVPMGSCPNGSSFGVTFLAPAFHDAVVAEIAQRLSGRSVSRQWTPPLRNIVVFGAHRRGQPLHHQIADRGGEFAGIVRTAPEYSMLALDTEPMKPAVLHTGRAAIVGERWLLRPAALAAFVDDVEYPMTLGKVRLDNGEEALGFVVEPRALHGEDITADGDWLVHLAREDRGRVQV